MGLARFSNYKYVKTVRGWRYCRPACSANDKIKPNIVLVEGRKEPHSEGTNYLNVDSRWEKAGVAAGGRPGRHRRSGWLGKGPSVTQAKALPSLRAEETFGAIKVLFGNEPADAPNTCSGL